LPCDCEWEEEEAKEAASTAIPTPFIWSTLAFAALLPESLEYADRRVGSLGQAMVTGPCTPKGSVSDKVRSDRRCTTSDAAEDSIDSAWDMDEQTVWHVGRIEPLVCRDDGWMCSVAKRGSWRATVGDFLVLRPMAVANVLKCDLDLIFSGCRDEAFFADHHDRERSPVCGIAEAMVRRDLQLQRLRKI